MTEKSYDAIVLGAGPAGEVVAGQLAGAGWKIATVEKDLVGGECSYYACIPSKALLRPADVLGEARRIPGVPVDEASELDPQAILDRRDEVIHYRDDSGQLPWLEERGIALHRGAARMPGQRRHQPGAPAGHRALLGGRQLGVGQHLGRGRLHQRRQVRRAVHGAAVGHDDLVGRPEDGVAARLFDGGRKVAGLVERGDDDAQPHADALHTRPGPHSNRRCLLRVSTPGNKPSSVRT